MWTRIIGLPYKFSDRFLIWILELTDSTRNCLVGPGGFEPLGSQPHLFFSQRSYNPPWGTGPLEDISESPADRKVAIAKENLRKQVTDSDCFQYSARLSETSLDAIDWFSEASKMFPELWKNESIVALQRVFVNRYLVSGCGGWIWTTDHENMSLAFWPLNYPALVWRSRGDLNSYSRIESPVS